LHKSSAVKLRRCGILTNSRQKYYLYGLRLTDRTTRFSPLAVGLVAAESAQRRARAVFELLRFLTKY
jgi:hypothetical protein